MPKLIALTPIGHDTQVYAEGDTLDVSDERQAQALIDCGAAELATPARKPRAPKAPAGADAGKAEGDAPGADGDKPEGAEGGADGATQDAGNGAAQE